MRGWFSVADSCDAYLADAQLADAYLADAYLADAQLADAQPALAATQGVGTNHSTRIDTAIKLFMRLMIGSFRVRVVKLRSRGSERKPRHGRSGQLMVTLEGHRRVYNSSNLQLIKSATRGIYHSTTHAPQDSPDPKPHKRTFSPRRSRPSRLASSSANGMLPADVFP